MSHQIKINLSNESTASQTFQPIIISWTNPSTDNQSQMIDETRIKQEDELQIISQVIREVPHPANRKSAEIISPTRVLRSHGKVDKSPVIVTQKNTKKSPKSRSNSKLTYETQSVEVFTKTIDISTKKASSNGETSPWTTTVQSKRPTKSQALSNKIESNSNKKSSKKLVKFPSKSDELENPKDSQPSGPKRRFTSKTVIEVIQEPKGDLKIDDKTANQLKKDKNGNSLKITNKLESMSKTPATINKRKSCSPFEASSDPSFNNKYIKKEKELDIAPETDTESEDSTKIPKPSIKMEPEDQISRTSTAINLKKLQHLEKSSTNPKSITTSPITAIKDEDIDEITIKVTDIKPKSEPVETLSQNGSNTSETTNSSPLKYFNLSSSSKIYESGLDDQYRNKFIPITKSSSSSLDITASNDQIPADSNNQEFKSSAKEPETQKYEDEDDDDDDEDRLIIKEEEDDIETIDISDSDDEKPGNLTPKKFQNSWNNLTSQSLINGDSDSLTSSNHVSISYPSIDGSTSLQPPVIQISYQFPMDSQHSASSTQIQKHFSSSRLEPSSQMHKNLGQQSTFGQLFSKNPQQSSSKYNFGQNNQNMDKSKLPSKNMIVYPSTSQVGASTSSNNQQTSQKRRHSALMTQNSSTIPQSSSKSLEHLSKKQKVTSDPHQIPIIPYNPSTIPPRRISSTSSDGSSSTSHPFQCKMCLAIFKRKIDMIHHLKSHSEAKFECQRCGMKFKFEGYFSKHECIACNLCNKTFFLKQQLRNHQRNEHDIQMAMYECDLCDKKLRYRHGVLYHMSKTHMLYLEDKYACDVCGKRFKLKESIRLHIKNHESVIECNLCDKKVKRINLNVHMKSVHATERNFKCRICRTTFKTKECLKSHMRTHEKSFECTECGKRFSNKSHLKEHMEWHKNPEAYKCKICQKSFSQKYCLKAHVKLHESGHLFTKFKCSSCPYSTDKPENFEKHELKHKRQEENEEMRKNWLQCEKCPVKLKNKLKLATHYWKKHSEVMPK